MAGVFIDIPGVGNVEAKNAASESTLREILAAMRGGGGGGGGARGGVRAASPGTIAGGVGGKTGDTGDAKAPADGGKQLGSIVGMVGKGFGTLAKTTGMVVGGFGMLTASVTKTIEAFANVGDSVESAAGLLNVLPIMGPLFGAVATAATKVTRAFNDATASGATFGGSMQTFSRTASEAGMTMEKYGALVAANGEAMLAFGTTTEGGATRFATVAKQLQSTSSELYALGMTTDDINQGLASYGKTLKMQGRQGTMTNAELAAGSKKYLTEMDLLAKVTGESRKDQEKAREKLLMDAQVQSKIAQMTKEDGEAFMNTINGLPPGLRDVAKDIMVTGTATTEESIKFSAAMPETAAKMRQFAAITESGGKVTAEMQQELQNIAANEGKRKQAELRTQGMYNKEFAGTMMQVNNAAAMNKDALTDAEKAQAKAQTETDAMNKRMQEAQQMLAKFSNGFQMALVNSGMLDLLIKTFGTIATFVQNTIVPAFHILASIVATVGGLLVDSLAPGMSQLSDFITNKLYPVFQTLAAFVIDHVVPGIMTAVSHLLPIIVSIGETLLPPLLAVGEFIFKNLTPILLGLGIGLAAYAAMIAVQKVMAIGKIALDGAQMLAQLPVVASFLAMAAAMLPLTLILLAVTAVIALAVYGFKKFGGDLTLIGDGFKWLWSYMEEFGQNIVKLYYTIMDKITPGSKYKDLAAAQDEKIKKTQADRAALETAMSQRVLDNRAAMAAKEADEQSEKNKTKNALDLKNIKQQQASGAKLEDANKKQAAAEEKKLNLNANSESVLQQFAAQQGSGFIKDKPGTAAAAADKGTTAMVNEADKKKAEAAEAAKLQAEKQAKEEADKKSNEPAKPPESAETLLAQLNTHMAKLLALSAQTTTNTYETVMATKGLNSNLFKR